MGPRVRMCRARRGRLILGRVSQCKWCTLDFGFFRGTFLLHLYFSQLASVRAIVFCTPIRSCNIISLREISNALISMASDKT